MFIIYKKYILKNKRERKGKSIITNPITEARNKIIFMSKGPSLGLISLPCQKLYTILSVDAHILRHATGALFAFIYKNIAKIVPRIHPLVLNCKEFSKIKS